MTNIKMQYKWLPTAPCSRCVCVHCCVCVCVCVCVCSLLCVCVCVCVHCCVCVCVCVHCCVCVCVHCCVCVCVCVHCCVCVHFGWVKCRAQIPSVTSLSVALYTVKKKNESVLILIRIFIIVSLLKYSKYTV